MSNDELIHASLENCALRIEKNLENFLTGFRSLTDAIGHDRAIAAISNMIDLPKDDVIEMVNSAMRMERKKESERN